ncbi:cofilin [Orbilia brochopaga]|uniref:Cofilin n=1 Tax=Orbilia brochopaga TaxID=3140254 RepID=A0AAV9UJ83_9PEZI
MSRSGVAVANECVPKFEELKLGKKLKYIIYKLNDNRSQIIVEQEGTLSDSGSYEEQYEEFVGKLPETDCRWAIYDFEYELTAGEGKRNKICFISWSPDDAKVLAKMTYASSKDALRRALAGIAVEVQGSDFSEVSYETVLEKCSKGR